MIDARGKVAVFFEASGVVRDALIRRGVDAVSIDLRETERAGPHIVGDVFDYLEAGWSGAIMHPTCTYLCSSGLHWNHRVAGRNLMTEFWIDRVKRLMASPIDRWCVENPRGCISTRIRKADQAIQPYQFGHDASKETCFWLKGLPPLPLDPELFIPPRIVIDPKTGKRRPRWGNQTDSGQNALGPSDDRWAERSETYSGVAESMAATWAALFGQPLDRNLFGEELA